MGNRHNVETSEVEYTEDREDFLRAVAKHQGETGKRFMTATDYFDILTSMGYLKPPAIPTRMSDVPRSRQRAKIILPTTPPSSV